jgi:hypothetical protein
MLLRRLQGVARGRLKGARGLRQRLQGVRRGKQKGGRCCGSGCGSSRGAGWSIPLSRLRELLEAQ